MHKFANGSGVGRGSGFGRLGAYQVAAELLQLVARIRINDAELRQQARKSAKSAVLNTAEVCGSANAR